MIIMMISYSATFQMWPPTKPAQARPGRWAVVAVECPSPTRDPPAHDGDFDNSDQARGARGYVDAGLIPA